MKNKMEILADAVLENNTDKYAIIDLFGHLIKTHKSLYRGYVAFDESEVTVDCPIPLAYSFSTDKEIAFDFIDMNLYDLAGEGVGVIAYCPELRGISTHEMLAEAMNDCEGIDEETIKIVTTMVESESEIISMEETLLVNEITYADDEIIEIEITANENYFEEISLTISKSHVNI